MPASAQSSYIHILDDDALLHIFTMNADMFLYEHALRTTRATSQLCQRWRNLMLDTPSIWAKLLDIDRISWARDVEWRNELMKRSGTAPLWIRVDSVKRLQPADPAMHIRTFFFNVVHGNWHRIQKLVVHNCSVKIQGPAFPPASWEMLCRPAPELDTFDVSFERAAGPAENLAHIPVSTLFAGCAPKLRRFNFPCYTIDGSAPWLSRLHSMEFDSAYSVRLALAVLSSAHHLQRLEIHDLNQDNISTPLPIASLPHLKYLEYTGPAQEGAMLLDHIEIPLNCSVYIPRPFHMIPNAATEDQCYSIITTFVRYIQRHLQSHVPNLISLDVNGLYSIIVEVEAKVPGVVPLVISIPLRKDDDPNVPFTILNKLAFQEFACVTEFKFYCVGLLNPAMGLFFSFFTSLRIICAKSYELGCLTALQNTMNASNKQIVLFPLLEVINLNSYYDRNGVFKVDTTTAAFILLRMRAGYPITTLHLLNYCCTVAPNLEALAEAEGLKVMYTCRKADEKSNEGSNEEGNLEGSDKDVNSEGSAKGSDEKRYFDIEYI